MTRAFLAIRLAFAFLTIVRIPIKDGEVTDQALADARFAFPLVGLAIGLILAGISEILRRIGIGAAPSAFLLVAASALLSGGLHLDGLADSADGLFLWGDPARRLAVMRDPHIGSFGVIALILVILGKFAVLESLSDLERWRAVLGAALVARCLILVVGGLSSYARPDGTGRVVINATTTGNAVMASVITIVVGGLLANWVGLLASFVALVIAILLTRAARSKLGGVTGDILGAAVELGEFSFLMVLAIRPA